MSTLQELYNDFNKYRTEECEYALDGFVIKPILPVREQNTDKVRPSDCVAVKFVPDIQKTKVVDIVWNQGKSGEYTPVIVFEPVVLLDKTVTKCSGHNYGYLVDNQVGIGTEIEVSLAGDIIPFLYSILGNPSNDLGQLPTDAVVEGCHLMGIVDNRVQFIAEGHADFGGIASEGYSWVYNHQSPKWLGFNALVNVLTGYGISMTQLMSLNTSTNKTAQVPVMLTGSPSKYVSKKEFLEKNPQYIQTNSWSEAKVLFTGDLISTSSKMLKANKLGLRIELY